MTALTPEQQQTLAAIAAAWTKQPWQRRLPEWDEGVWKDSSATVSILNTIIDGYRVRPAPFDLALHLAPAFGPLPPGWEPHRDDFTAEDLPPGWRPVRRGESVNGGDDTFHHGEWHVVASDCTESQNTRCGDSNDKLRTRRPFATAQADPYAPFRRAQEQGRILQFKHETKDVWYSAEPGETLAFHLSLTHYRLAPDAQGRIEHVTDSNPVPGKLVDVWLDDESLTMGTPADAWAWSQRASPRITHYREVPPKPEPWRSIDDVPKAAEWLAYEANFVAFRIVALTINGVVIGTEEGNSLLRWEDIEQNTQWRWLSARDGEPRPCTRDGR